MKRFFTLIICFLSLTTFAQDTIPVQEAVFGTKKRTKNMNTVYHRSSLHNILIFHDDQKYSDEILETYKNRPQSEKFNDHTLASDIIKVKGAKYLKSKKINKYVNNNDIANALVAKWFNRNEATGYCDMELIYRRGLEGATTEEIETAGYTKRGKSLLMDMGTDLIGNTYVLAHDIVYIDKGERNEKVAGGFKVFGEIMKAVGEVAAEVTGEQAYADLGSATDDLSKLTADVVDDFEGFRVKIKTHLYRLDWKDADNDFFFENYYMDAESYDAAKLEAWKKANYTLTYVGSQEVVSAQTVLKNKWDLTALIKIVLYRALDESVVKLQRNYEEFKIKEPIYEVADSLGLVYAKIGLKEGVSKNSKYEVLERVETKEGDSKYRKVGMVKPVEDLIWDNRYMALEDGQPNAELGYTTFKVTQGKDLYPGLLIREVKF
ncbi:MAG: hypothetical protein IJE76_06275 [Bacteroidales bacterium]|nr:hypothetical protein [Bacteroidales bacterium]